MYENAGEGAKQTEVGGEICKGKQKHPRHLQGLFTIIQPTGERTAHFLARNHFRGFSVTDATRLDLTLVMHYPTTDTLSYIQSIRAIEHQDLRQDPNDGIEG